MISPSKADHTVSTPLLDPPAQIIEVELSYADYEILNTLNYSLIGNLSLGSF